MISWRIQIDMLLPPELHDDSLYQVSLEQAAWADKRGLCDIWLSEHHGSLFISKPLVLAGALGAVTERARIIVGCLLLPLHDPIRVAEDHIMASNISRGRTELIAGIGYIPRDFTPTCPGRASNCSPTTLCRISRSANRKTSRRR